MIPLAEKLKKQLADRFDLPVFKCLWVWATARITASGGQPNALLATQKNQLCIGKFVIKFVVIFFPGFLISLKNFSYFFGICFAV